MVDLNARHGASMQRVSLQEDGFRFEGNCIHNQPPPRPERGLRHLYQSRSSGTASNEYGIRRWQILECIRDSGFDYLKVRDAEGSRVAPDPRRPVVSALDCNSGQRRVRQHPLDGDRPGARANIPQVLPMPRRQG